MRNKIFVKGLLFLSVFFFLEFSIAQGNTIKGNFNGKQACQSVMVYQFVKGIAILVDSIKVKEDTFVYKIPVGFEEGVYRFAYMPRGEVPYTDVIYTKKEVSYTFENEHRYPVFAKEGENKVWNTYKELRDLQNQKLMSLLNFNASYPAKKDRIVKQVEVVYAKERKLLLENKIRFLEKNKGSWAALIEGNSLDFLVFPIANKDKGVKAILSGLCVDSLRLLRTPVLKEGVYGLIDYYMKAQKFSSKKEFYSALKKVADSIMGAFQNNKKTGVFALRYLQKLFAQNDEVLQYIDEKYQWLMGAQCTNEEETSEDIDYKKRLESYEIMRDGNKAPNIYLGSELPDLYHLEAEGVLVMFWASWCPHCMSELPVLVEWSAKHPDVVVVAISVDKNLQEYGNVVKEYPSMLHYCDGKGWKTKAATDYHIKGTPTLFLLDSEKRIKGKYARVSQIKGANVR